jgi:hypothetical protein
MHQHGVNGQTNSVEALGASEDLVCKLHLAARRIMYSMPREGTNWAEAFIGR